MLDKDFVEYSDGDTTRRLSVSGIAGYVALYGFAAFLLFGGVQAAAWLIISLVYILAGL